MLGWNLRQILVFCSARGLSSSPFDDTSPEVFEHNSKGGIGCQGSRASTKAIVEHDPFILHLKAFMTILMVVILIPKELQYIP